MELKYTKLDPTGNITIIVETPVERSAQRRVAALIMSRESDAEQLGFLETPREGEDIRLQMAGGEFCGNAALSAASLFALRAGRGTKSISVGISGSEKPVRVEAGDMGATFSGTVTMPAPQAVSERAFALGGKQLLLPVVGFPGISHIISVGRLTAEQAEDAVKPWCEALGADALGIMLLDANYTEMTPLVYVPSAGTLFWERSCASGTSAVGAYLAASAGKNAALSLREPGGSLFVEARVSGGAVSEIRLTGRATPVATKTILI